jgi:hypothetical protein
VINASASGGGVYTTPPDVITWPAPVPVGQSRQLDLTLDGLVRPLLTTILITATFETVAVSTPALPAVAGLVLVVTLALLGAWVLARRGA